jgi:hypothetical protein
VKLHGCLSGVVVLLILITRAPALASLTTDGNQFWWQASEGISGDGRPGERFGSSLAFGDFDGDGFQDLVVGVPGETYRNGPIEVLAAGAINVIYGSMDGLTSASDQRYNRGSELVSGRADPGDFFGSTVIAGDFNGDGFDDVAIGVPNDDREGNTVQDAGSINVIYGSDLGLSPSPRGCCEDQLFSQSQDDITGDSNPGDLFGSALAVGDFDADGFDDLAVGIPGENFDGGDTPDGGRVEVIYGSANGLNEGASSETWRKSSLGRNAAEFEVFGSTLSAGDFDGDGFDDLAVGAPGEKVGGAAGAGATYVIYGAGGGLQAAGNQRWTQDRDGIKSTSKENEEFGAALASGDFNADGFDDLAIGVPREDINGVLRAGAVNVILGSAVGLGSADDQFWHQDEADVDEEVGRGDRFGSALAVADFDGDGFDDLAIGVPREDRPPADESEQGGVNILYGSLNALVAGDRDQFWAPDLVVSPEVSQDSQFGSALAAADINGDGYSDLAAGLPGQRLGEAPLVGGVSVLYGVGLLLLEPDPGVAGTDNTFVATQAAPGAQVLFLLIPTAGGAFPSNCPLEVTPGVVCAIGLANADGAGVASVDFFVESELSSVLILARDLDNDVVSNRVDVDFSMP